MLNENPKYKGIEISDNETERFRLYRSLVNIRPATIADKRIVQLAMFYAAKFEQYAN